MAIEGIATMPLADYQAACEAVRTMTGEQENIKSGELAEKILSISTGVDIGDTTATANDVLLNKVFYTRNGTRTTGTIPSQAANTYLVSTEKRIIEAKTYCSGAQQILGVRVSSSLKADNIRKGITVTIGDEKAAGRIKNITGTFEGSVNTRVDGIFVGNGLTSKLVTREGISTSNTIVAWQIYGGGGDGGILMASGMGTTGSGIATTWSAVSGYSITENITVTCNAVSNGFSLYCSSPTGAYPTFFSNNKNYGINVVYQ